ncbi:MAG: hypothetical protein HXY34_01595 [Candidatus Thorarchaeota archaeon]|nr:hypothetical protein [Candidatus Thorarchaeota archaeon]
MTCPPIGTRTHARAARPGYSRWIPSLGVTLSPATDGPGQSVYTSNDEALDAPWGSVVDSLCEAP